MGTIEKVKTIKVALVGTGDFASVCHIPGIRSHSAANVVAVCGRDAAKAAAFARQEGIDASYTSVDEMLKNVDCDAVAVATPDAAHYDAVMKAIAKGKHVFCEKPLAMNPTEAAKMVAAAEQAGVINMVAFTFRYAHALREMRRLIRTGLIGRPHYVSAQVYWGDLLAPNCLTWRDRAEQSCGGIWADAGSHIFDAVSFLFGPVDEVFAQLNTVQREQQYAQTETIDFANCIASTHFDLDGSKLDVSVLMQASRLSQPRGAIHELQVFGSNGSLGMPLTRGNDEYLALLRAGSTDWERLPLPQDATTPEPLALGRMMRAFIDAIGHGRIDDEFDASFRDGLTAQLALEAGIRSAKSKKSERVVYG